ncbi:mesotocin-neurophysin MT-like [Mustelus asterias]
MASQRSVLLLVFLLLIVNAQFSRAQHWSHGWYPGGKRELSLSQTPEVSEEIKLCRGEDCLFLRPPRKDVIRSIVCMQCGPENKGHCFGPRICCGERFGCYIGTAEAVKCEKENYIFSPCEPIGRSCGKEGGKCASSGVCCTDQNCVMDTACDTNNVYSSN